MVPAGLATDCGRIIKSRSERAPLRCRYPIPLTMFNCIRCIHIVFSVCPEQAKISRQKKYKNHVMLLHRDDNND